MPHQYTPLEPWALVNKKNSLLSYVPIQPGKDYSYDGPQAPRACSLPGTIFRHSNKWWFQSCMVLLKKAVDDLSFPVMEAKTSSQSQNELPKVILLRSGPQPWMHELNSIFAWLVATQHHLEASRVPFHTDEGASHTFLWEPKKLGFLIPEADGSLASQWQPLNFSGVIFCSRGIWFGRKGIAGLT